MQESTPRFPTIDSQSSPQQYQKMSHPPIIPPDSPAFDLTALLNDGRHFSERRGDRIYIIDSITGNTAVVYVDAPPGVPQHFVRKETPTGVTWIQEGLQPAPIDNATYMAFSPAVIHLMCAEIANGKSITKLCGTHGFPRYPVLRKWARVHPWIDEEFERARRDRSEYFRDKVIDEAEKAESHKDPILASQLKTETYKWAAAQDHERYNPKTKIEATLNTPTQIIIQTGIVREAVPVPPAVSQSTAQIEAPTVIPEEMRKFDE